MTLKEILDAIARITGQPSPRIRLPHGLILPLAYFCEAWAKISGGVPRATRDGVRMARKHMYFSSGKAKRELGYEPRSAGEALGDAIAWFQRHGYIRS